MTKPNRALLISALATSLTACAAMPGRGGLSLSPSSSAFAAATGGVSNADAYSYNNNFEYAPTAKGGFGDYSRIAASNAPAYRLVDAASSELATVALLEKCFIGRGNEIAPLADVPLLFGILCTRTALNQENANRELDDAEISGANRGIMKARIRVMADAQRKYADYVQAQAKIDPGVAKLVAIADTQVAKWRQPSAVRDQAKAMLAQNEAALASGSRSAMAGCEAKSHQLFSSVLATTKLPAVQGDDPVALLFPAVLSSPEGYLSYMAMRTCAMATNPPKVPSDLEDPPAELTFRGPLSSVVAAWMAADKDIVFDQTALNMTSLYAASGMRRTARFEAFYRISQGTIAALKPVASGVEIAFAPTKGTFNMCVDWQTTNRIKAIDAFGVHYEKECKKREKQVINTTPQTVVYSSALTAGLKPGMYLSHTVFMPLTATAEPSSDKLLVLFGGALK